MPRARNIKPSFFDNEDLPIIPAMGRLLFIGLWTLADREGRLEDRPRKIKGQLFAYEDCDVEKYLQQLYQLKFINRYTVAGIPYIEICNFVKHQSPHHSEKPSAIPEPEPTAENYATSCVEISLIPDTLILNPDSLNPENVIEKSRELENEFEIFWELYPKQGRNKGAKNTAEAKFKVARKKDTFENIIQGVKNYAEYIRSTNQSNADTFRWLERERWREDYAIPEQSSGAGIRRNPSKSERARAAAERGLAEYQDTLGFTAPPGVPDIDLL